MSMIEKVRAEMVAAMKNKEKENSNAFFPNRNVVVLRNLHQKHGFLHF